MNDLLLLLLCSPSGGGKTTLTRHLLATMPELTFSVSHTTRAPRPGEVDGREYHFVDREVFEAKIEAGELAEWALVHGNLYGTSVSELQRVHAEGYRGMVLDVDYQGARQIKARIPSARGLFILPPSLEELRRRLEKRGSDGPDAIERRFRAAHDELAHYPFFDYLVVNDDLEEAKAQVVAVARAELVRRERMAPVAESLLRSPR
jgi:guanylate kinase